MKPLSEITCCFCDLGLHIPMALKLAQTYKRVLYWSPWEHCFPAARDDAIGDGFEDIERTSDFWDELDDIDFFVFPDAFYPGLQLHLREMGYPVWGSAGGVEIEQDRILFLRLLQRTKLPMPKVKVVRGISGLRAHLMDEEDKYIKISKYRGTMETWHWRSWDDDSVNLDVLAVKLGALSEIIEFMVCDAIPTDIEVGADTYCIDGKFPKHIMEGYEWKDKGAFAAFKPRSEVTHFVTDVLDEFGPFLADYAYRNYFSAEVRVQDGQGHFIDPCCRGPLPMTASQLEVYGNLAEIVYAGAQGELVEPEPAAKFSCECVLTAKTEMGSGAMIEVPEKLEDAMKIMRCARVDNRLWCPAETDEHEILAGWLVATGNTPRETLEKQLANVKLLPEGVCAASESLVNLLKEIGEAEAKGMEFSPLPMPEPEEAIPD